MGSVLGVVRSAAGALRRPLYLPPGHYSSPSSSPRDVMRAETWRPLPVLGVDLRPEAQEELVRRLALRPPRPGRWQPNRMYGPVDVAFLQGMLLHEGIRRVVEVGSGWSTAAMLDAVPDLEITCIEPYPDRLRQALGPGDEVRILAEPVQDVDRNLFMDLGPGDLLFVDSSHVGKAGSDVLWLFFHVLPVLVPGVLVHVHDVHWPFEYPSTWLRQRRDWSEVYLLRALLSDSAAWRIEVMTSWVAIERPELLPPALRGQPTGSLWMRRLPADDLVRLGPP